MKLTLTGIPPYDGEYPLDLSRLTNRDIHTIKRISGYAPLEYHQVQERGDVTFFVALAVIALKRGGHAHVNEDALWDAEAGAINVILEPGDAEGDADPPHKSPSVEQSGTSSPSGLASRSDLESPPVAIRAHSGIRS